MSIFLSLIINVAVAASPYSNLIDLPKEMPATLKSVVERDFELLAECEFKNSSPLFNEMFKLNESKNFDPAWFRKRITRVGADSGVASDAVFGRGLRLKVIPRTCGGEVKPDSLTLGPFYFAGTQPERIATLIHEARHADGCSHTKFPENFSWTDELPAPTKDICDSTSDGQCDETSNGASGAHMIFLVNFARNCVGDLQKIEKLKFRAFSMFSRILNSQDRKKLSEDLFSVEEIEKFKKQQKSPFDLFAQIESKTGRDQICEPLK